MDISIRARGDDGCGEDRSAIKRREIIESKRQLRKKCVENREEIEKSIGDCRIVRKYYISRR